MHGYDLAVDPEDGTRLYMGADDGVVIHGSTQVRLMIMMTISMTYFYVILILIIALFYHQADHRPSPRLFKPEIETSAACNSIGG